MFLFPLAVLLSLFRLYYARGHGWWFYWVFTKVRYQSVHMFTWFHLTTHEQRSQRRSAAERRVVVEWEFQIVQIEKKLLAKREPRTAFLFSAKNISNNDVTSLSFYNNLSLSLSLFLVSRSHLLTHLPTSSKFFVGPWLGRNGRCSSLTSGRTCVRIPHHID